MKSGFVIAVILSALVNSAQAATYAYPAASEEMYAFELLNNERSRCGFNSLRQNVDLDSAAKNHANWLFANNAVGHMQIPNTPGFTGAAPWDRIVNAAYGPDFSFESTEVQVFHSGTEKGSGASAVRSLLNAPYHLMNMIRGFREFGIGVREKINLNLISGDQNIVNIVLAAKDSEGLNVEKTGLVRTYPCEGSIGMVRSLRNETPNPFPERHLDVNPVGASIGVVGDVGSILTISSAIIINVKTGANVTILTPVTGLTDKNATADNKFVNDNEGFVSSSVPLEAHTPYQVTITGTMGRAVFSRAFTFTTGDMKY